MRGENVPGGRKRHRWMSVERARRDDSFSSRLGRRLTRHGSEGFTLLEALVSVAIIGVVMGPIFFFLLQVQRRFQANAVVSESNQGARAAMQAMAQEIGQAGFNPQFTSSTTSSAVITASPTAQCVTLGSIVGINPGDYLSVDSGSEFEQVEVKATSNAALSGYTKCTGANQISAIFLQCHNNVSGGCPAGGTPGPFGFLSDKYPFPSGILQGQTVSYNGSNITISSDHMLAMYYGDSNNSGNLYYVVYSLYNPTSAGNLTSVTINGNSYNLYTLYRSVTPVNYATGQTITHAYPLVNNVIYQDITGSNPVGPTGKSMFTFNTVPVTVVPNVISVVGTVGINISVAVNPSSLEAQNVVQYYTMASQIRPVNLWAAVSINQTGGESFLPPMPVGLPMAFSSPISNYYF